ncbi:MAG TPA: hypothetical protein VJ739_14900, partial [Gemmataceae bacterium]|nr:hypothetical protein [Gemmataceae bacterium]
GNGQGQGATAAPVEDRPTQPSDTPRPQPQVKFSDLDPGKADPLALPEVKDEHGQSEYAISDDVRKMLSGIQEDARKKLFGPLADKGPGSGREKGPGHGPGNGPDGGERTGKLSQRQKRVLRWSMTFNTGSGDDYLRQLANIKPGNGAILAIPQADGSFRVLRDLRKRPAVGEVEDVSKIHRIFWVDDKPDSVAGLARALGIAPPAYFVAFFPEELEQELAKREHDYKGRSEERVEETKFAVLRNPDGTYHAQVLSQMGKD